MDPKDHFPCPLYGLRGLLRLVAEYLVPLPRPWRLFLGVPGL